MPLKLGILSLSVGRASAHSLEAKLDALQATGFRGIELFYEDLEFVAALLPGGLNDENRIQAARKIRIMCDARKVEIINLQPLLFFGGLTDRRQHAAQIQKLMLWFQLISILGTDLIHVPTNFQREGVTGDVSTIVADLTQIANLGLAQNPPVRFVYEAMAWGRFIETWEQAWEVVCKVDRPNFGICLDTFQIAARVWADPTQTSARLNNGEYELQQSLTRMTSRIGVAPEKLFLVQTGDAERLSQPLSEKHPLHVDGQPFRMTWSRNARLFAHDTNGDCFLRIPVDQICDVIFNKLRYSGWVSCEVYSNTLFDEDPSVPIKHARRAADGWRSLLKTMEELRMAQPPSNYQRKVWGLTDVNMAIVVSLVVLCTVCPLMFARGVSATRRLISLD